MTGARETLWWMSFADPSRPKGQRFLGVIVTTGLTFTHAVNKTHLMGINPGGEIEFHHVPEDFEHYIPDNMRDRLLTKEECESLGPDEPPKLH